MAAGVPRDIGAGVFLIAVGAFALWQGADLAAGSLRQVGPGMLPRALAVMSMLCGVGLIAAALRASEASLEAWSPRGLLFILGAAVAFGLTVRPLGLLVAGPLAVMIGTLADRTNRVWESALLAVVLTAFCIVLFKALLRLPIPVAPWLGY